MTKQEAKEFVRDVANSMGSIGMEYWTDKTGEKLLEAVNTLEEQKTGESNDAKQMETNEVLLQIIRKLHKTTKEDVDILSAYEDCEEKAKMLPVAKFFFKFGIDAAKDIVRSYLPEDMHVSDGVLDEMNEED